MRLLFDHEQKTMQVRSVELNPLGTLFYKWETEPCGVILALVSKTPGHLSLTYQGPKDLFT